MSFLKGVSVNEIERVFEKALDFGDKLEIDCHIKNIDYDYDENTAKIVLFVSSRGKALSAEDIDDLNA